MRLPDWRQRLSATIEAWRYRDFAYGHADCLQFTAEAYQALTGIDHRLRFPQYQTRFQAARILVRHGGVRGLIVSVLGPGKAANEAHMGDLVLGDFGNGETAGVCLGPCCCSPGERGLEVRPTNIATEAWSV